MADTVLDERVAHKRFERAASTYETASVLAREVERRMGQRLDYVKQVPRRVLDAGCGPGEGLRMLRGRYPDAELIGLDISIEMARAAASRISRLDRTMSLLSGRRRHHLCGDMSLLPLAGASVGLVWSNLALPWVGDPIKVFHEFRRVLEVGGLLMFSSYGPDTLRELRAAFVQADARSHVHEFIDMHDLGDMLLASGFAEPVMDMEILTLTYDDVPALFRDIRLTGQANAGAQRARGLTGRRGWQRMIAAYESRRSAGRLPASFEIIYGHAWKPKQKIADKGEAIIEFFPRGSR